MLRFYLIISIFDTYNKYTYDKKKVKYITLHNEMEYNCL